IEVVQGNQRFYLFKANARLLEPIVDINRRDPKRDVGYQRFFSSAQINSIAKYFERGMAIPSAILITFDAATYSNGELNVPEKERSGWVIDGQHRLLGACAVDEEIELPVIAFIDLPLAEQVNQFVTINKEARGVPSSLYLDLLKKLPFDKTASDLARERVTDIAEELNEDEESPFYGKIVIMTSPRKGEISLTNFARKVQTHLVPDKGLLAPYDLPTQVKIISNYFEGMRHVFVDEFERDIPIIYQTIGFGALMNVFPIVFTNCIASKHSFTVENVAQIFDEISSFNFDAWRQLGTGTQAENRAAKDIEVELTSVFKVTGDGYQIKV
ncbi:MAG: DGQHR domain-containing protein, partial [Alphaproteobacteria bacterium]|nr:DGQHR domain-containing protein [Alphaproteobacteria bacterium]